MHKKTSGAQYEVVSGYSGTAEIALAMERGEIDGACGWDWSSFKSQRPDWIAGHKVNLLLQVGLEPNPELTQMGVPSVFKYIVNEQDRKAVELIISQQVFQRSYIAPPGLAPEPLDALRSAFDATMVDRQFLADAEKIRIDIHAAPRGKGAGIGAQALCGTQENCHARPPGDRAVSRCSGRPTWKRPARRG